LYWKAPSYGESEILFIFACFFEFDIGFAFLFVEEEAIAAIDLYHDFSFEVIFDLIWQFFEVEDDDKYAMYVGF
jgi:hypothetical protein